MIQAAFQTPPHSMKAEGDGDVVFVLEDTAAGLLEAMPGVRNSFTHVRCRSAEANQVIAS